MHPNRPDRQRLYRRIMDMYAHYLARQYDRAPKQDFNFAERVMRPRYGVTKCGLMSLEQLTDLVKHMSHETSGMVYVDDERDLNDAEHVCDCESCAGFPDSYIGPW